MQTMTSTERRGGGEDGAAKLGWFRVASVKVLVACASLSVCCAVMTGCDVLSPGEPKVTSPFSNKPATGDVIRAEADAAAKKAAADAKAQADTMAANLRAEADAAKVEQARRKAAFDQAVASLDADTRVKLASLQAEYETASLETTLRVSRMAADTERAVATLSANAAAKIDAAKSSADLALAGIADIAQRREAGLSLVTNAANLIPGYGPLIGMALTGIAGAAWGTRGRVKASDATAAADRAWDEAWAKAHETRNTADANYDAGKNESVVSAVLASLIAGAAGKGTAVGSPAITTPPAVAPTTG